jgi:hypothetical protein
MMETVSLDDPYNPANLRAFIDATAGMTGTSADMVLAMMAEVLVRQLRRQSDDMKEAMRLGRILQAVRAETDSARSVV